MDGNQSGKELVERDEAGSDEENEEEDGLVDIGPNIMTGGEGTSANNLLKTSRHYTSSVMAWSIRYSLRTGRCWRPLSGMACHCFA